MTEAEQLECAELRVPVEMLAGQPAGAFYHHELIGCRVKTVEGMAVGTVSGVEGGGGVYRLVVANGSDEMQVPLVAPICVRVDPLARAITIDPPEGLLDLNPPRRGQDYADRRA